MSRFKEFWIREPDGFFEIGAVNEYEVYINSTHVIDFAAYLDLKSKLEIANNLINKFNPQDNFVFDDDSQDLSNEVSEYLEALKKIGVES